MQNVLPADKINSDFVGKDIISLDQFDTSSIEILFDQAITCKNLLIHKGYGERLKGSIFTLLFFEPSSRTFSSFASAIKRSGGETIEYQNPMQTSSAYKGETLEDAMKMFQCYSDCIIMRHFETGAAQRAAAAATVPVINAGDGSGEHPTQALLDMFTIYERFGKLDNLKILFAGDMMYGRTVHSLIKGLSMYENITIYMLSPERLKLQPEIKKDFEDRGVKIEEISSEKEIPSDCNLWYWTRVQKERFDNLEEYESIKTLFTLTPALLAEKGNNNMIIMHPLPRVGEIDIAVDADPRALYLNVQPQNGVYVRMALLTLVLGKN